MYSLRVHAEISLKSLSARRNIYKILISNLRTQCRRQQLSADIRNAWDKISIKLLNPTPEIENKLIEILTHTPGIQSIDKLSEQTFNDLEHAYSLIRASLLPLIAKRTFMVRVKRTGTHDFTSVVAERYFGHKLLSEGTSLGVKLKQPDICLNININNDKIQQVQQRWQGLGGFPIGSQGQVLSLISGGFDSGVASYQMLRRGLKTHYIFFNLGGVEHEIGVEKMARYLWQTYSSSHQVNFISVPFENVLEDILSLQEQGMMGVILKRQMLKAASQIAQRLHIKALVTGEVIAQVSSQTIDNLASIDKSHNMLCLRPLICSDKQTIIDQARDIGIEQIAASIPEYCAAISKKPLLCIDENALIAAEEKLSTDIFASAITNTRTFKLKANSTQAPDTAEHHQEIQLKQAINALNTTSEIGQNDQVIDIRHPSESQANPLPAKYQAIQIAFYELAREIEHLDKNKRYLLYCQQGSMSKSHALRLRDKGNFAVFKPTD